MAFGTSLEQGDQIATASVQHLDDKLYSDASENFRQALSNVTASSRLWEDHPRSVNILIRASVLKKASSSLFMHENSTPLINLTRKLIKDATTKDTGDRQQIQVDNLFVAVHILRAIAFVHANASIERKESLLKLFYHLINTASDINRDSKTLDGSIGVRGGLIALAGYEGLGQVLAEYSTQDRGSNQKLIHFDLVKYSHTDQRIIFSVPRTNVNQSRKVKDSTIGTMSTRQLSTIALQTTNAASNVILSFLNPSVKKRLQHSLPSCYGSLGSIVSDNFERLHSVLVGVSRRVHEPWLLFFAKSSPDEPELAKEVVSYAKGIHRLLWDAATQLKSSSDDETNFMETECLELRKAAIELLLPSTSVDYVDTMIRTSLFDSACTYAWKAATVFSQCSTQGSPISGESSSNLANFYQDMDSLFKKVLVGNHAIPLGFVEYVAYQSLHIKLCLGSLIFTDFIEVSAINAQKTVLEGDYRSLLRPLILGIIVRQTIEMHQVCESQTLVRNGEKLVDCVEQVMRSFNEQITQKLYEFSPDIRSRMFKAIASLSLHKALFSVLKLSVEKLSVVEPTVMLGAKILTDCLGPFALCYSNLCKDKSDHVCDLIVECYIRPIAVLKHLRKEGALDPLAYTTLAGAACRKLYENVVEENLPIQCVEKAAKVSY